MYKEKIPWIEETPLGIATREITFVPPHFHDDIIEIIFCLNGSIKFNYEYEEFTLHQGEFISVDKDTHYLYAGKDDLCVSFYIDLNWFKEKFPYVGSLLFVCESCSDSVTPHRDAHDQLKGMLISLLFYLESYGRNDENFIRKIIMYTERILDLFIKQFDIMFFYHPDCQLSRDGMNLHHSLMHFLEENSAERLTLEILSQRFHLTKSYISEFFRKHNISFRKCLGYHRAYKSERFLLATNMNINDISEACGFSDPKYYYNVFRAWYFCTPKQFRDSYAQKMNRPAEETFLEIKDTYPKLNKLMCEHYLSLFL